MKLFSYKLLQTNGLWELLYSNECNCTQCKNLHCCARVPKELDRQTDKHLFLERDKDFLFGTLEPPHTLGRHSQCDFVGEADLAICHLVQECTIAAGLIFLHLKTCKKPLQIFHDSEGEAAGIRIVGHTSIWLGWQRQPGRMWMALAL